MPRIWLEGPPLAAGSGDRNHRPGRGRRRPVHLHGLRRYRACGGGLAVNLINAGAAHEAVTQLEALARELAERDFAARVTGDGGTPNLSVSNPTLPGSRETIAIAQADDGVWCFWWSWGARIAPIDDVGTAAFKIAYVLTAPAVD